MLAFGRFDQSLKVIMYALLYVYGWTDGKVSSFVKKQAKMKKGPFRTRAETTHVKMPPGGAKATRYCESVTREIKKIYRENN